MVKSEGEGRVKGGLRNDTRKDGRKAVDKGGEQTVALRRGAEEEGGGDI